jgi:hypothetical protein
MKIHCPPREDPVMICPDCLVGMIKMFIVVGGKTHCVRVCECRPAQVLTGKTRCSMFTAT